MIKCNTQFGKLKVVVVGRELQIQKRFMDISFKYFYKEAIGEGLYNSAISEYKINDEILSIRIQQLDNLAKTLKDFGIDVYRPQAINQIHKIKTPAFDSIASTANNVRDLTLVYKDKIIETPTFIRNRYFENMCLYSIFNEAFNNGEGGQWIKAPNTELSYQSMDLVDWEENRDFNNIDKKYQMAIDAAQFICIGKDVIVNASTYNHWLGFKWVKSLFPESTFWPIKCSDSHIDGMLVCLAPGKFLANPLFKPYESQLPKKFKKWDILYVEDFKPRNTIGMSDINIQLASSRGMDINVLSLDEKRVLVNEKAKSVIKCLEKNGFEAIPFELDYGELFGGGIHCSTLDLVREDEYISYA